MRYIEFCDQGAYFLKRDIKTHLKRILDESELGQSILSTDGEGNYSLTWKNDNYEKYYCLCENSQLFTFAALSYDLAPTSLDIRNHIIDVEDFMWEAISDMNFSKIVNL